MLHEVLLLLVVNVHRADTPHHGRLPCCHGAAARQLSSPSDAVKNARARGSHGYELRMVTLPHACYCAHLVACASHCCTCATSEFGGCAEDVRPTPSAHIAYCASVSTLLKHGRQQVSGEWLNVRCRAQSRRDGAAELDPQAEAKGTRNSNSHGVGSTACKVPMPCCSNNPS